MSFVTSSKKLIHTVNQQRQKSNFDDFGTDLDPFLLLDSECAQSEIDQSANQGIFPVVLVLELECQS